MSKIVFTNGCFDVLHPGHIGLLRHARELAGPNGVVIVGINSDESVRRLKGDSRPVVNQRDREASLRALRYVDHVFVFDEPDPSRMIEELRPDVVLKGWDYAGKPVIAGDAAVVIAPRYGDHSTTGLLQRE